MVAVDVATGGRTNFSHALEGKVKKIIRKVTAARTHTRVDRLHLGSTGWQSATGQIRRGERVLFGSLAEKLLEGYEPKCPCKAVGVSASCRFQSALLVGGLETAAPCVGASRPHSPLASHHQLRPRRRSWPNSWWRVGPWRRCRSWSRGRCGCRRCRCRGSNCGRRRSSSCDCGCSRWRRRVSSGWCWRRRERCRSCSRGSGCWRCSCSHCCRRRRGRRNCSSGRPASRRTT